MATLAQCVGCSLQHATPVDPLLQHVKEGKQITIRSRCIGLTQLLLQFSDEILCADLP